MNETNLPDVGIFTWGQICLMPQACPPRLFHLSSLPCWISPCHASGYSKPRLVLAVCLRAFAGARKVQPVIALAGPSCLGGL
ncbi:hypothetical protein FA95DRAFT_256415 [Auriscalpium vulgare]|uniref:Uncharacterized protein n=1 Tax=Auriscalpium vulgare TaxID=40419 RepID=A0ACB8RLJ8_9AGAM|nr:hypothetical protein FA95DRAFT_256415 [Auriscalpium vulgare]